MKQVEMRYILQYGFVAIMLSCIVGCKTDKTTDSKTIEVVEVVDSIQQSIPYGRVIEDTAVGHWTLKTIISPNDALVKRGENTFGDSSVFVTLSYDNRPVFIDKEIRTKDLMGQEGEYQMYWGGGLHWYSDSTIYLTFGCFLPDTDDGWPMLYQIRKNGTSDIITEDYALGIDGYDIVSGFMTLYFSERATGVAIGYMKTLFDRYCNEDCATELLNGNIEIASADTDFRNAGKTMAITWETEDGSDITSPKRFYVRWKPNPNDENVTDEAIMVVDYSKNKISKIEGLHREII